MESSDKFDDGIVSPDIQARRRQLHTEAEQRRRDAIKKGFDNLLELIHPVKAVSGSSLLRMSKATVLNRSISMIGKLASMKSQKLMEIERLEKEVKTLKILNSSYERISMAYLYSADTSMGVVTEKIKLQLFQMFMESLFQSFDEIVSEGELPELSEQIITWLESNCKPELLRMTMESLMNKVFAEDTAYSQSFEGQLNSTPNSLYQSSNAATQFDLIKSNQSLCPLYNSFAAAIPQKSDPNIRINHRDLQSIFSPRTFGPSDTPELPHETRFDVSFPRPDYECLLPQVESSSNSSKQSFKFQDTSSCNNLSQNYHNNTFRNSGKNSVSSSESRKTNSHLQQAKSLQINSGSGLQSSARQFHRPSIGTIKSGRNQDSGINLIGRPTDST